MSPYSPTILTVYQDLVQQVHAATDRYGSIFKRTIKGIEYAYIKQQVGSKRRDIFLGRTDDDAVLTRIEDVREATEQAKGRRKLIGMLKSAGIPAPTRALGQVLDALADAGILRQTVVVGTAAYQCYAPIVGEALPQSSLMTQDADLATASLTITSVDAEDTMEAILRRADKSFRPVPGLDPRAPPSSFRSTDNFVVDLLTPRMRRDDRNPMPLDGLNAGATPLQYLRWLIESPLQAVALHGSGVGLHVPSPARFAVHKLIIAQKRAFDRSKRDKDLRQARALIDILARSDRWAISDALDSAIRQGKAGWKGPIDRSLKELDRTVDALTNPD